jgi:hypothetical protein
MLVCTVSNTLNDAGLQDDTLQGGIIFTQYGLGGMVIHFCCLQLPNAVGLMVTQYVPAA